MQTGTKGTYAKNRAIKVRVSNLTKYYGDLLVLDNINFDIYKGELLCIVGPTGCGKTTFLNCLSRFIPITTGSIDVDGHQRLGRADAPPVFQPGHALLSTPIEADLSGPFCSGVPQRAL